MSSLSFTTSILRTISVKCDSLYFFRLRLSVLEKNHKSINNCTFSVALCFHCTNNFYKFILTYYGMSAKFGFDLWAHVYNKKMVLSRINLEVCITFIHCDIMNIIYKYSKLDVHIITTHYFLYQIKHWSRAVVAIYNAF